MRSGSRLRRPAPQRPHAASRARPPGRPPPACSSDACMGAAPICAPHLALLAQIRLLGLWLLGCTRGVTFSWGARWPRSLHICSVLSETCLPPEFVSLRARPRSSSLSVSGTEIWLRRGSWWLGFRERQSGSVPLGWSIPAPWRAWASPWAEGSEGDVRSQGFRGRSLASLAEMPALWPRCGLRPAICEGDTLTVGLRPLSRSFCPHPYVRRVSGRQKHPLPARLRTLPGER